MKQEEEEERHYGVVMKHMKIITMKVDMHEIESCTLLYFRELHVYLSIYMYVCVFMFEYD
jgi:hypothetical protein